MSRVFALPLVTDRLSLRNVVAEDEDRIVQLFAEPEAQPYILSSQKSAAVMRASVGFGIANALMDPRTAFHLVVVSNADGAIVGTCTLTRALRGVPGARIGWHFAARSAGSGLATEAAAELVRFAFDAVGVASVRADCFASNARNIRVLEKIGLRRTRWWPWLLALRYGEPRPIVRYVLDAQEWQASRRHGGAALRTDA